MTYAIPILSVLLAVLFVITGRSKVFVDKTSLAVRDQLGFSASAWRRIGFLEWCASVGLLAGLRWPVLGIAANAGIILLMVGAGVSRMRVRGKMGIGGVIIDVVVLILAAALIALFVRARAIAI